MKRRLLPLFTLVLGLTMIPAFATSVAPRRVIGGSKPPRAITAYAERLRVDKPLRYGDLVLFPISVSHVPISSVTLTLDKAVNKGTVEVMELDRSEVNRLRLRNRGKEPVFVMAGEMVRGGKQDRIIGDDLILPPKSTVTVPAYCVEHGRWTNGEAGFSVGHSLAGGRMRKAAQERDQSAVWSAVAEQQEALKAPSATGALRSVHDSAHVRDQMKPYLKALSDLPKERPTACGVVAVADGRIMAADLFSSRALFQQLYPQLLEAYVIDALEGPDDEPVYEHRHTPPTLDRDDIADWLRELRTTSVSRKDTPGNGDLNELHGGCAGAALTLDGGVVHLALFPAEVHIMTREPDFNSLEFRRQHAQ